MAARDETTAAGRGTTRGAHRHTTETKASFKTSEFVAYIVVFIGILVAANTIEGEGGDDFFTADKAWLYITILTLGYMLSAAWPSRAAASPTRSTTTTTSRA